MGLAQPRPRKPIIPAMHEPFAIRGATVFDGAGSEPYVADVIVRDGRIDPANDPKVRAIDGEGLILAPGFIDCHCHDDLAMLREPDRPEKVAQGVTTVVTGNCGFSLFPCTAFSQRDLVQHAGSLLGSLTADEVFESIDGYRSAMHQAGIAINVAPLVGHGPIRLEQTGFEDRPATPEERRHMASRLQDQLLSGAAGLSLGLVYPPSAFADREELLELCRTAQRCGKPVAAHIRTYEAGLLDAAEEFIDLLRTSGAKGVLSHLQAAGRSNWGLVVRALEKLDAACQEGIDIAFDMYPYLAGSSYALQLLPPRETAGGIEALKAKFRNAAERDRLRAKIADPKPDEDGWQSKIGIIGWDSVLIAGAGVASLKPLEGKTMQEAANDGDPFSILERLVLEEDGATAVILFQLAESDVRSAFTHLLHMVGSDGIPRQTGRPHPRAFGAFPRVLDKLVRQDRWLSLSEAVRRMTSEPAKRFNMAERGYIRPGAVADLVLFEPGFRDLATYEDPRRLAEGARYVWVNGIPVLAEGKATGARPGQVIPPSSRKASSAPQARR